MFCIYKLNVGEEFYVGSTCNINKRFYDHNHRAYDDKYKDIKLYNAIRNNDYNMDIEILCWKKVDKKSSFSLEQEFIDKLNPTLNSRKSVLNIEESREKNKLRMRKVEKKPLTEEQKEKKRQRYLENKQEILSKAAEKIKCDICNVFITRPKQHNRSIKHQRILKNMETF